jgi:hypothetical protein
MTLEELLSELRGNILHDRSHRVAGADDALWSDATLIRYIDEAQRRFARRAWVIRDSSHPDATRVTLRTGVTLYTLHPSLLGVISVRHAADMTDIARAGHSEFATLRGSEQQYWRDPGSLPHLPPGKPLVFSTDDEAALDDYDSRGAIQLRVYPAPTAEYDGHVLRLRVVRMPIDRLTARYMRAVPEIPEEHHLEMLDWAAYLALRIVDIDAGSVARAQEFAQAFEAHVLEARKAMTSKMFAPMRWDFGRNGWSW